jgi:hypothetical protein
VGLFASPVGGCVVLTLTEKDHGNGSMG